MNRNIYHVWNNLNNKNVNNIKNIKTVNLNFGPQHPASHGVLRLIVQLNGEIVEKADPHIGLLHRGSEKLMEDKIYLHSLPYFDRFDYVSMLCQEHAYCLAIESLLGTTNYTASFTQIRTLFDELTRILNHLLAVGCHALDVGSMASVFWTFEEREKIMEFYERVSGARMHAAFYRPNEVNLHSISGYLLEDILNFSRNCFTTLNEMHNLLTYNKIWKQRLVNIGSYSSNVALKYGLTGVMSRCTGIKRDIRLSRLETYSNYYYLNFRSFIGQHGDCYDRYLIRMSEMTESLNIITQVINKITLWKYKGAKKTNKYATVLPHWILNYVTPRKMISNNYKTSYTSMEELIKHFKYWSEGFPVKSGWTYQSIESPKGEFGVSLIADNTNVPYKCKVRSPAYHHMHVLPDIVRGHFLADLSAMIGTVDIVLGEIDR